MDEYTLLESLFGAKRAEGGTAHMETATMTGVAVEDSDGGQVRIIPDGHVAAAEGEDNTITIPTSPNVEAGDNVLVSMTGGVSKSPMVIGVVASGDRIKGEIDDFKEYAEVTYTHETEFDEVTGAISNTITANYSATAPNISPFFSFDEPAADSITNDYWARYAANPSANTRNTSATVTPLSDGWLHIVKTAGTSNVIFAPKAQPFISANGKYTLLFEFKNVTVSGTNRMQIANVNYGQLCATGTSYYFQVAEGTQRFVFPSDGLEIRSTNSELVLFNLNSALVVTCDMRVSLYEGEYLGGYKPYSLSKADAVKEYATRSYVSQTADAIELEVSQTAAIANTAGNPNLSPFFSHGRPASGTADDYWSHLAATYTILDDGWGHYANDRSEASSTVYPQFSTNTQPFIEEGAAYTLLVELRNVSVVGGEGLVALRPHLAGTSTQLPGSNSGANSINLRNVEGSGTFYIPCVAADDFTDKTRMLYSYVHHTAGANVSFDIRVSLYEGDYKGTYKPYVDTTLGREIASIKTDYATKAELSVQEGSVGILAQGILTKSAEYTDNTIDTEILGETGAINVTKNAIEQEVSRVYSTKYEAADGNLIEQRGLVDGYIRTDGTISASDTAKEWTTALIGVTPGQVLSLTTTLDETPTRTWTTWIAYCFYDSNQAKVGSRTSKYGTANVDLELSYPSITVPSGAAYIRCSWRYYNVPSHAVLVPNIDATYASKSSLSLTNDAITAIVSKSATYVDPTTGQTQTNGLSTTVNQTASDVSTLLTDVGGIQTMIRETTDGILVAKTGNTVGALVNADGSFDVVELTWSGDTPTAGTVLSSFSDTDIEIGIAPVPELGTDTQSRILMNGGCVRIVDTYLADGEDHIAAIQAVTEYTDQLSLNAGDATVVLREGTLGDFAILGVKNPNNNNSIVAGVHARMLDPTTHEGALTLYGTELIIVGSSGSVASNLDVDEVKKLLQSGVTYANLSYLQNGAHFETDDSSSSTTLSGEISGKTIVYQMKFATTSNVTFSGDKIAQIARAADYPCESVNVPVFCISSAWTSPVVGWLRVSSTDGGIYLWTPSAVSAVFGQIVYVTS